jgi:hypothetical protein
VMSRDYMREMDQRMGFGRYEVTSWDRIDS